MTVELKGKRLDTDRPLYIDCDDTLVMWDKSQYGPEYARIPVECYGEKSELVLNQKNVNLAVKFAKLGYPLIVWSQSGSQWAEAVSKAVGLDSYVSLYLAKPAWYMDDLPAEAWLNRRVYRQPDGKEIPR